MKGHAHLLLSDDPKSVSETKNVTVVDGIQGMYSDLFELAASHKSLAPIVSCSLSLESILASRKQIGHPFLHLTLYVSLFEVLVATKVCVRQLAGRSPTLIVADNVLRCVYGRSRLQTIDSSTPRSKRSRKPDMESKADCCVTAACCSVR